MKLVRSGDPYSDHIKETIAADRWRRGWYHTASQLCYQSKVGPLKWLDAVDARHDQRTAAEGVKHMLIVPVAFTSDHLETLFELDIEYRHMAAEAGVEQYEVTTGLNDSPTFIDALASLVFEKLGAKRIQRSRGVKKVAVIGAGISGLCDCVPCSKSRCGRHTL